MIYPKIIILGQFWLYAYLADISTFVLNFSLQLGPTIYSSLRLSTCSVYTGLSVYDKVVLFSVFSIETEFHNVHVNFNSYFMRKHVSCYMHNYVHCVFPDSTQEWIPITVPRTWPGVTFVRPL